VNKIKNMKKENGKIIEEKGLGDIVKSVIETTVPKLAKKYEDCKDCEKRVEKLNKFGKYIKNNLNANFG
tara:strand:- start:3 stop:209 length:207 start_codon:yes stop_codon:yes gene_type:complete